MLNQVILVGRVVRDLDVNTVKDGRKIAFLTLAVNRNYRNQTTGVYETDFFNITLWEQLAELTAKHCKKGSIIGVKGHLSIRQPIGESRREVEIIADKVTFISLNKPEEDYEIPDAI